MTGVLSRARFVTVFSSENPVKSNEYNDAECDCAGPMEQREAQWPSIFHFFCKYSLWFNIIGVNVATNVTTEIQALVCALSLPLST